MPDIKNDDKEALSDLSMVLLEAHHYFDNVSLNNQLNSPTEIMAIVRKLPFKMRERWRKLSNDLIAQNGSVGFSNLVDFIC